MAKRTTVRRSASSPDTPTRRRPSERRARKAAALRQKLVACALAEFEKRGVSHTPIDAITQAADVGKGTFYNYFSSRESLLGHWGRQRLAEARGNVLDHPAEGEPALRLLFRFLLDLVGPLEKKPALAEPLLLALIYAGQGDEAGTPQGAGLAGPLRKGPLAARTGEGKGPAMINPSEPVAPTSLLQSLEPVVAQARKEGVLRSDREANEIARALSARVYGALALMATGEDARPPVEQLRAALALALEGLAPAE